MWCESRVNRKSKIGTGSFKKYRLLCPAKWVLEILELKSSRKKKKLLMKQGMRFQIPEAEIPAPARSDQNRGEFGMKIHAADGSRDHGRFIAVEHEFDGSGLRVPNLDIHIKNGFFLLDPLEPGRRDDMLVILAPHAVAQLHFGPALREIYGSCALAFALISQCSTVFSHTEKSPLHRHRHALRSASDAVSRS